jgi:hypothetical protein
MDATLSAIEVTGLIDEQQRLHLDHALPIPGPLRVRVIVLYPNAPEEDEQAWLRAAAGSPVFADLSDPSEDIYSLSDGKPLDAEV